MKGEQIVSDLQNTSEYIKQLGSRIEQELTNAIPQAWDVPLKLRESMLYSLMAGGKRLRPALVLAATEAVGGDPESAIPIACAIECVHTYSLVHDDLPAMDNDDYRRGKLTNHKVYGEAMAILAGDGLLTQAFYWVCQATRLGVPADRVLAIVEELSIYAGASGMVGGQAADMEGEQGLTSSDELDYIHQHKTGDLIVFSLKAGARVAGASEQQLQGLQTFGHKIGLAFQIQDDILDITGDEQKLGKPIKSDEKQQKVTYPYFIGLEASMEKVRLLTEQAKQAISVAGFKRPERLIGLADYLMSRDH